MKTMTNQQIFDKVARHLLKQGVKAMGPVVNCAEKYFCAYRSKQAGRVLKCAVGCLIPKRLYEFSMESGPLHENDRVQEALTKVGVPDAALSLLETLQSVHDHDYPETWRASLRTVARAYNLSAAVLDES